MAALGRYTRFTVCPVSKCPLASPIHCLSPRWSRYRCWQFAKRLQQKKLVLIDGAKLAELMMDFGVGVSRVATYTVQKIDPDYFGEE